MSKDANLLRDYASLKSACLGRATLLLRACARGTRRLATLLLAAVSIIAASAATPVAAEVDLPKPDPDHPIVITAESAARWTQGAYEVWVLRGNCRVIQGRSSTGSNEGVVWIDRNSSPERRRSKVIAYLEGQVTVTAESDGAAATLTDKSWLGRLFTNAGVQVHVARVTDQPDAKPAIYYRGMSRRDPGPPGAIRRTQYEAFSGQPVANSPLPAGARRVRVYSRSNVPFNFRWERDPRTNQWIALVDLGVNLIVDSVADLGSIDVSTDRLVIWTTGVEELDLSGEGLQAEDLPLEIYMEGNIVFRQGDRVIYANRMYYDVANRTGVVLGAEVLTPVPQYEGLLRLKAEILRQTGEEQFFAQDVFITSSRMGRPGYRIQSQDVHFEDHQRSLIDPATGLAQVDPETGEPLVRHDRLATGRNNMVLLGEVPIFYWPWMATDLTSPNYYIRRVRFKNDSIFGTQLLTSWDGYQMLGIREPPPGTDWDVSLDYLGKRGLGYGTTFGYSREGLFRMPGPTSGLADVWAIDDHGIDNLGSDRRDIVPDKHFRYRLFWQHRHLFPNDLQLSMEAGWMSDSMFLEEYYKREWNELKDQTTSVELRQSHDNMSWSITGFKRINDFFTQVEWLPRADHFWMGQSLLGDALSWYEHSQAGYGRLRIADVPTNAILREKFAYLPWEATGAGQPANRSGERISTRQEIDWPLQLGPVKCVPYALGELTHWGEDLAGDDLQRAYFQVGARASMPIWRVDPTVEDTLFNVHGLTHKVVFDIEFAFTEANRDLTELPLYDQIDENSIKRFLRRMSFNTFGMPLVPAAAPIPVQVIPRQFDERFYAVRTGLAGWVTAPSTEIVEDLAVFRLGARQRWQTKRGVPGQRRIVDWITLDTNAVVYPNDDRDNFGKPLGLLNYDFRWHVGDRLTLVTDGMFDFFDEGQQMITFGGFLSRPPRGSLYLGLRMLEGPFRTQMLTMSYDYRMSPKWVSAFGTSIVLDGTGNYGHNLSITRIGESFLVSAGATYDRSRDNFGVHLAIEPRFLPKTRLGRAGGAQIPPAGAYGLE